MPPLRPTFTLTIGTLQTSSDRPVAGLTYLTVDRDMDSPGDGLRLGLMARSGIQVGDAITLALGHDGENQAVFAGTVARLLPTIAGVQVQGIGKLNALATFHTAQFYDNQTAGHIARDLIQQAGLTAGTLDSGPTLPRYAVDRRLSVYGHLRQLAQRLGYELYGDRNGNVMFHGLGAAAQLDRGLGGGLGGLSSLAGGATHLMFGHHVLQAQAIQQRAPAGQVTVGGESPMSRQGDPTAHWLATADNSPTGTAGQGHPTRLIVDGLARTRDLADRLAAGVKATGDRTTHRLQVRVLGLPRLDLGDPLQTQALPDTGLNGSGYVRSLCHRFGEGSGFTTDLTLVVGGGA
ncbi:MAG: hypothetical protein ACHWZW_20880 [Spirulina sp.]